jgi:hypothetical protein
LGRPEPGKGTPVELQAEARRRPPGAALPMPGRPTPTWRDQARRPAHALHRGSADGEALDRRELLGEVVAVEPRIPSSGQGDDLRAEGLRQPVRRRAAPIAVDQGHRPVPPEAPPEAADLPGSEAQCLLAELPRAH